MTALYTKEKKAIIGVILVNAALLFSVIAITGRVTGGAVRQEKINSKVSAYLASSASIDTQAMPNVRVLYNGSCQTNALLLRLLWLFSAAAGIYLIVSSFYLWRITRKL